jgi:hypothetical protein
MDYFDVNEELHSSIQDFRQTHGGEVPSRVFMSPYLFQWLTQIRLEEANLKGQQPETIDLHALPTEFGTLSIGIDELLSDYEIITE